MSKKIPEHDPEGAHVRRAIAARRTGSRACSCGEARPEALIPDTEPTICAACRRRSKGQRTEDQHHVAGASNHPLTIPTPVNDHRADLSTAQLDWPKTTRENRHRSPLLAGAGMIRGFVDYAMYLIHRGLVWAAEMLEAADALLLQLLGPGWWRNTPLARFAPTQ
jgi:hypothetical protein